VIDHQVWILPEVPGAVSLSSVRDACVGRLGDYRTGLQAISVFIFDRVLLVIEHAVEPFVQMRDVVSAVQVIVNEHLPITRDIVCPRREISEVCESERSNSPDQTAQKVRERFRPRIEVNEYEVLPGLHPDRYQPVGAALEVLHSVEFRHALQRTIQPVIPAVIRAPQNLCLAAWLSHDGRGMMSTYVIERAQH